MAFTPITSAQIEVGEPTKKEIFTKTKDNFDDHETRISSLEAGATSTVPGEFLIQDSGLVQDEAAFSAPIPFDITITDVKLTVETAGSAGTLEVDVLSDQGGSFSTVLSGNLTRAFGDGDRSSVSAGSLVTTDVDANKFFRLDVKAVQTGMRNAKVQIFYTVR
jgi:hypothetical protein